MKFIVLTSYTFIFLSSSSLLQFPSFFFLSFIFLTFVSFLPCSSPILPYINCPPLFLLLPSPSSYPPLSLYVLFTFPAIFPHILSPRLFLPSIPGHLLRQHYLIPLGLIIPLIFPLIFPLILSCSFPRLTSMPFPLSCSFSSFPVSLSLFSRFSPLCISHSFLSRPPSYYFHLALPLSSLSYLSISHPSLSPSFLTFLPPSPAFLLPL